MRLPVSSSKPCLLALGALLVGAGVCTSTSTTLAAAFSSPQGSFSPRPMIQPATPGRSPLPTPLLIAQQSDFASFFETGTLRSENRLQPNRPNDPTIRVNTVSQGWQFLVFRRGNVSIWVPPGALTQETVVLNTAAGDIPVQMLVSDSQMGRYVAAYASDLTPAQSNPQLLYEAIKQRIAAKQQLAVQSEQPVTAGSFSGREIQFGNAEQTLVLRMYVVNNQLYVLGVQALNANANPRATRAFLNSLQVLSR